jgi:uncharacterized protein (TIGR02996 family)
MAEQDELLQAVLENPDDDALRLSYADWCQRQTDQATKARAEFIRLQIKMSRVNLAELDQRQSYRLQHREITLTDQYRVAWAGSLGDLVDDYTFYRGFVELVTLPAREFLERASLLFSLAPIRHLNLSGVREVADELFLSEHLSRIQSLSLDRCALEDNHMKTLAASPVLAQLRWLSIAENDIGMDGAEALAASSLQQQLEYVNFSGNRVDPCEEGGQDSGVIVATWLPEAGQLLEQRYGYLPWLHRTGATVFNFHPSRFQILKEVVRLP